MKNTLGDLNNYLFETLERLMDDGMTEEEMEREVKRSKAVTNVAKAVIHSGELALKAQKYKTEYGKAATVPNLLEAGKS